MNCSTTNNPATVICGDSLTELCKLPGQSVQCCVTSPPYWGLWDYQVEGQLGMDKTPQEYVEKIVEIFRELRRVLKDDGTLWLNLGDSYARNGGTPGGGNREMMHMEGKQKRMCKIPEGSGLKSKDLIGIPWRVALALQADGWWLRSDIIWAKQNCMPESVTDRPTRSHEYLFLLTKSERYHYDHEAIKEPCIYDLDGTGTAARKARQNVGDKSMVTAERNGMRPPKADKQRGHSRRHDGFNDRWDKMEKAEQCTGMRNKRDVWTVAPANYPEAHFATFPAELIRPCVRAGTRAGDVVLDPFAGSGTTGQVALEEGRQAILIELNPSYIPLIHRRLLVTPTLLPC